LRSGVANEIGPRKAARTFNVAPSVAAYWSKKVKDPEFHPKDWGGNAQFKFTAEEQEIFQNSLWTLLRTKNNLPITEMVRHCKEETGLDLNTSMIFRQLKKWKFSVKKPFPVQRAKYTADNLLYYAEYIRWFSTLPHYLNVKFLGESHFDGRKFQTRSKIWSPIGDKNNAKINSSTLSENYSVSAIIGLQAHQDPVFLDMRIDSNTQYDFAEFVYAAIINKYLESGDILIMDAAVHSGQDSFVEVLETLEDSGIDVRLLPTYSPELSPIELIIIYLWNCKTPYST